MFAVLRCLCSMYSAQVRPSNVVQSLLRITVDVFTFKVVLFRRTGAMGPTCPDATSLVISRNREQVRRVTDQRLNN